MVLTLDIQRFDPVHGERGQRFTVAAEERTTVLDALLAIQTGQDPTLAFRYACRVGMCGSCVVVVNGRERWACRTRLLSLRTRRISIRPLYHFPVIRDLVVDMTPLVERMVKAQARFVPRRDLDGFAAIGSKSRERRRIDAAIECIGCGACLSACSFVGASPAFAGPAPLLRAFTLMEDTRDGARPERLEALMTRDGLAACHGQMNCVDVCPMELAPAEGIAALRRRAVAALISLPRSREPDAAAEQAS